ncbi:MAG: PAS domain-containing protein [Nitrosomonas sp.]|nr:PAS domain-containing protein [Nitrosomonas sp.]
MLIVNESLLSVLLVGFLNPSAEAICKILTDENINFDSKFVDTHDEFLHAIQNCHWDVIIANAVTLETGTHAVLNYFSQVNQFLKIPVIIVSNESNEQSARGFLKAGAYDFMLMSSLVRLAPVIKKCAQELKSVQENRVTQLNLQKSEARFRAIASNLPGLVFQFLKKPDNSIAFPFVSEGVLMLLGLTAEELTTCPELFYQMILPEDQYSYNEQMQTSAKNFSTWNWEGKIKVKGDRDIKWISLRATPRQSNQGGILWDGIVLNITRNKLAEIELANSHAQLAELSSYLQKIKEHERMRIAREIHDDIGGTLTAIKCELQPCIDIDKPRSPEFYQQKTRSIEELVDYVIDSTRRISLDLRPGVLDVGIVASVHWQAREFSKRNHIPCEVLCESEDISLNDDLAVAIFRIFQETLTNITKHANASIVKVRLAEINDYVLLEVIDNGRGITDLEMKKPNSFGIRGIRERCQQLGGDFFITGTKEKGTSVLIKIPIEIKIMN